MKADFVIYTHVLGVPGQYDSVALMLSHKMISIVVPIGIVFANPVTISCGLSNYKDNRCPEEFIACTVEEDGGESQG